MPACLPVAQARFVSIGEGEGGGWVLGPAMSLVLGEMGGVVVDRLALGLVETDMGAPGLANFSGLEMPGPGVKGSLVSGCGRGGRERGPPPWGDGEGRKLPWGSPEWNLARAAGGVKESLMEIGMGPPDSLRSP